MGAEQKVVVITGASQGFGAALVNAYRDRNYRVKQQFEMVARPRNHFRYNSLTVPV